MNSLRLIDPMKQIANVSKLLVNNKKCLKANMSNEKLLKEILEARIAERNRLFEENSHLKDEIVRLKVELAEGNVLIEDMDKEFAEIWEQNCLLEEIVKNKNSQLADLDAVEENYEALKDEADWMSEELDRLEKTNEALVAKVWRISKLLYGRSLMGLINTECKSKKFNTWFFFCSKFVSNKNSTFILVHWWSDDD